MALQSKQLKENEINSRLSKCQSTPVCILHSPPNLCGQGWGLKIESAHWSTNAKNHYRVVKQNIQPSAVH